MYILSYFPSPCQIFIHFLLIIRFIIYPHSPWKDYSKNNLHLYHFIYNHNLNWLWLFMDTLCHHSSKEEAIPKRIAIFFSTLSNLGNPEIYIRNSQQDWISYYIKPSEWWQVIPISSVELFDFLFPNLWEPSPAHRNALVQKVLETYGCTLKCPHESTIEQHDTDVIGWCQQLIHHFWQKISQIT